MNGVVLNILAHAKGLFIPRDFLTQALHILVLCAFAVAQPLYDIYARYPDFFVANQSKAIDIWVFVLTAILIGPAAVVFVWWLAALLSSTAGKWVYLTILGTLAGITVLPTISGMAGISGVVAILLASAAGIMCATLVARFHAARLFLTFASPALILFPVLFLYNPEIREIAFGPKQTKVSTGGVVNSYGLSIQRDTPVIMIIFDELASTALMNADGNIDEHAFPNFAQLTREFAWYRNATTVADVTVLAVPAMLSGSYVRRPRSAKAANYPNSLFALLGGEYRLKVHESSTNLCPPGVCQSFVPPPRTRQRLYSMFLDVGVVYAHIVLPAALARKLPVITRGWGNFRQTAGTEGAVKGRKPVRRKRKGAKADRVNLMRHLAETIVGGGRNTLYFSHVMLPHVPWSYLPSGKLYAESRISGLRNEKWDNDQWAVSQGLQRYLLQLMFLDKLVGEFLARIKQSDIYDDALIIFTSDHGISFLSDDTRRPLSKKNFRDILSVPIFIKRPRQTQGFVSDRNAETVDILPTIADVLRIDLPFKVDGQSLIDSTKAERPNKRAFKYRARKTGGTRTYQPRFSGISELQRQKQALFGPAGEPRRFFRMGPFRSLVGRSVKGMNPHPAAGVSVNFPDTVTFKKGRRKIPARLTGSLTAEKSLSEPLHMALSVNGTIQAVTGSFAPDGNKAAFSFMLPEAAFREGSNELDVFVITKDSGNATGLKSTLRD